VSRALKILPSMDFTWGKRASGKKKYSLKFHLLCSKSKEEGKLCGEGNNTG